MVDAQRAMGAIALSLSLVLVACGGDAVSNAEVTPTQSDDETATTAGDEETVTTESEAGSADEQTDPSSESVAASSSTPEGTTTESPTTEDSTTSSEESAAVQCIVRLHGKGGSGGDTNEVDGVFEVSPTGNDEAWGARQWLYFPDDRYAESVQIVADAVDREGCTEIVINGFSNGAAFAGKLYCEGEDFDGRLSGVIADDPVPDNGTADCTPSAGVEVALYWTGGLEGSAQPGADCAAIDWTCDGGSMVGIDNYASAMGTTIKASPFSDHAWYWDAPEIRGFLS